MIGNGTRRRKRKEQGAAIVESILAMLVLFLFLFGSLQIVLLYFAQDFADYAAFRGARSNAVGFAPYLVNREAKINAIGASGRMIHSSTDGVSFEDSSLSADQLAREKSLIQKFMLGYQYIEYEYWNGKNSDNKKHQTFFSTHISSKSQNMSNVSASFLNYTPCENAFYKLFRSGTINITGDAVLADHSNIYLEN